MPADVDVVVAVHDAARPIERPVASALRSVSVARVIVVCHNVPVAAIRARLGDLADDARVVLEAFEAPGSGPGGPFNRGLELARGAFTSVIGSDDSFDAGALDAWRHEAERTGSDVVIAPVRHAGGPRVPTPPTLRRAGLRGARDRLPFRTAPLGLVSRERFGDLRFTEGLATGEDLAYSTRLWFSGARIARCAAPAFYNIHDDAVRVTFTARPLHEDLRAVTQLLDDEWVRSLAVDDRRALAVKLWRVNLFGAVHYRSGRWDAADRSAAAALAEALSEFSAESIRVLSRAEGELRRALLDTRTPDATVDELSMRRRRFGRPAALLPVDPRLVLSRDAPLRYSAATWWAARA